MGAEGRYALPAAANSMTVCRRHSALFVRRWVLAMSPRSARRLSALGLPLCISMTDRMGAAFAKPLGPPMSMNRNTEVVQARSREADAF